MPYFLIIEKEGVALVATTTAYRTQMGLMGRYQIGPRYREKLRNSADSRHFRHFGTDSHCIKHCVLIDPCCGSGGMFVQSADFIEAHRGNRDSISVYGQESNADTWKMAKMNMAIRGIDANFGSYQADTFFNDLHPTLKADFIMANPPFNLSNWGQDKLKDDVRWKYGTPPAGNANYAWIQHMIHHLAPNGKIGLVLANGALSSQSSGEGEIRKNIIQDDLVEGIVALPTQLFYSVTIPVTLWFISKNKKGKLFL